MEQFQEKVNELFAKHETLLSRKNIPLEDGNGIFTRYQHPVLTAAHTPIFWRYDLNEKTNPYLYGTHRHERNHELRCDQME